MSETSIPLDRKTRDRIRSLGVKGETWIELINRIIDENEYQKQLIQGLELQIDSMLNPDPDLDPKNPGFYIKRKYKLVEIKE